MERIIQCPTCKKTTIFSPKNSWRPFCSEKCQLIDLGRWFEEDYNLPDESPNDYDERNNR